LHFVAQPPPPAEEKTETQETAVPGSSAIEPSRPLHVPGYRLLARLGEGTYGEVWLAQEEATGIRVAVKFFAHGTNLQWKLLQAEVQQLAQLAGDPGIVQLRMVAADASPPYYIMDLAEQGSLAQRLEKGPLPLAEALTIARQVAEALAYVHAKGIRHCDLKPGNVLLDARGRARIADFGQAHLSDDCSPALGTYFYMAPEQADLQQPIPDTRWDVYGLGAILYTMLTGKAPRGDATLRSELGKTQELAQRLERYRAWVRTAPRPMEHWRVRGMDRRLARIIDRCLEVDPQKRFRDAGAVLAALDMRQRRQQQRPLLLFGFVAPIVLLFVMGGLAYWTINAAISRSRAAFTNRLLESNLVNAHLVANVVEDQLMARLKLLKQDVRGSKFRKAIEEERWQDVTNNFLKGFAERRSDLELGRWSVADARGVIHANWPEDPKVYGQPFGWRDWFHGGGDQRPGNGQKFEPIRKPHISQPYFGKSRDEGMMIALSVPIVAPGKALKDPQDPQEIIGVLVVGVPLQTLHRWLTGVTIENGFAVLLDRRGHCLLHQEKEKIAFGRDQAPKEWTCPIFQKVLGLERGSTADHLDPIDGRTYLASYAPLPQIGWGVLVQHEREPALKPMADLQDQLVSLGWITFATASLLTTALWAWLLGMLRSG
jgi:serine/threonine protein kinase